MNSSWKDETVAVLDACALIAFLNDEPGAEVVAAILEDEIIVEMASVNILEIAYDAVRTTGDRNSAPNVIKTILQLPIAIQWKLDQTLIESAAAWKARFRISLADAVALALAETRHAVLATSDHHEFEAIEKDGAARFLWIR